MIDDAIGATLMVGSLFVDALRYWIGPPPLRC
jgi:hypothetical protein